MKKKLLIMCGVVIVSIFTLSILLGMNPKVMNKWADEKIVVMPNKKWEIEFSRKLNPKSITSDSIFIVNHKGDKQNVKLALSEDGKTITMEPPEEGFDPNASYYTLHIKKSLKANNGHSLKSAKKQTFIVQETLPVVGSKEKLEQIFKTAMERAKEERGFSLFDMGASEEKSTESAADSTGSNEAVGQGHSETNNQVSGVDEADTVKIDGEYIYQVQDGKVLITKAVPVGEMKLEGSILYKQSFSPTQIYLYKNQLVVIGYGYEEQTEVKKETTIAKEDSRIWPGYFQSTRALVYDLSDKKDPKQIRDVEIEGSYITSRRIGEHIYLVSNHSPDIWTYEKEAEMELRPRYSDSAGSEDGIDKVVNYEDIQYFPSSPETNYTVIAAFSLEEPIKEASLTTYLGSGHQLYMSKDNLYLAVADYSGYVGIRAEDNFSPNTNIYKFSIDKDTVTFQSTTEVEGTILNQFSMDEYKGHFRVVTTKGDTWDEVRPSSNNLYIYDEQLKQLGELKDLARGERIYSARFMQERIYVVTFKQVDPLFVIDASDPKKPSVLGELKIPGFSNYLHPYDENHIIGFGHDTKVVPSKQPGEEPLVLTQGVKISLFDVSDVSSPKEKFTEIIGGRGTYSPIDYDHKALLFHKAKGLFSLPVSVYYDVEGTEFEQRFEFQGAYVYQLDLDKGFQLQSKITHHMEGNHHYEDWESSISRVVYIGDYLYALSPSKITAHQMDTFELKGEIRFK
ncbi:beta-propeller domain-containing protein [Litchfieldia salsa]|uniref:Secreted protein containing C-terminal beta-propeller domain n=1 Tax=Litchfieldia salsa TaxID=930152 RepID=A0A1H0WYM9_9BACI|nr:beta-propeller domain-containing protein [Litchfieldia salsa]SDP95801.1 Secreted protein containing C-terminal beta-propeller domain [Litchfieldia salsa]